jgi:hypothetical protein
MIYCPVPPDYDLPGCQAGPCPNPPDKRVKRCKNIPFCKNGEPVTDNCIEKPKTPPPPIDAAVDDVTMVSGKARIRINRGMKHGVTTDWTGHLVTASGKMVANSSFKVISVATATSKAEVDLTTDQVNANRRVKLLPPPLPP